MLHFDEKGGKSREIPVRHDLQLIDLRLPRRGRTAGGGEGSGDVSERCAQR